MVVVSVLIGLFVVVPVLELGVLLRVRDALGLDWTLGLVLLTGVVGAFLAKAQGLAVLADAQRDLAEGRVPAPRLLDGVMILVAGAFLVTPGLITDTVGFLLLLPFVRALIKVWLKRVVEQKLRSGELHIGTWGR